MVLKNTEVYCQFCDWPDEQDKSASLCFISFGRCLIPILFRQIGLFQSNHNRLSNIGRFDANDQETQMLCM